MKDWLLILSCRATKRPDAGLLAALERSDGVAYRVLRTALREHHGLRERLRVLINQAEFR